MQLFFTIKLQYKIFIVSFFSIMESSFKKETGGEEGQAVVLTECNVCVCVCVH